MRYDASLMYRKLAVVLFLVVSSLLVHFSVTETAIEEKNVLHDLYLNTNGESWTWDVGKTPWSFEETSDPCINRWDGVVCDFSSNQCKSRLCRIVELELRTHNLTGGPLPQLSNLSSLTKFSVSANNLTGAIDASIFDSLALSTLSLSYNAFTGSLPSSIATLSNLKMFDITECSFRGSIPSFLFQLSTLQFLYMNNNDFSGTLPPANLPQIIVIALSTNRLRGTIPSSLFTSSDMLRITLSHNKLTGSVPSTIGSCHQLLLLYFSDNSFTNTIPSSMCLLSELWALSLYDNKFSGTIPSCIGSFQALQDLSLFSNPLSGTLPSTLGNLDRRMETMNIYDTYLHGEIPASIGNMTSLAQLYLQHNLFTGSMPDTLSNLVNMQYLSLNGNHLTGTIPTGIWKFTFLLELWLYDNRLSGSLPINMLAQAYNLRVLLLQNNRLSKSLANVFQHERNSTLRNVDLSGNVITGNLPAELFTLPQLRTVSAGKNCFTGSLPSTICNATWINTISLDGLGRNDNCKTDNLFVHPYRYMKKVFFHTISSNGVMDCVFFLNGLETLHMSGNGIYASIPSDIVPTASLKNISLTHNRLYGDIPRRLITRPFDEMDLSNNRFGGTLASSSSNVSLEYHLDVAVNRLSGFVPAHMRNAKDINVLVGNNFDCDAEHAKPTHDSHKRDVVCGSDRYEISLIIFSCCCGVLCMAIAIGLVAYAVRHRDGDVSYSYHLVGVLLQMMRYTRDTPIETHVQLKTDYLYYFLDMIAAMQQMCLRSGVYFTVAITITVLALKLTTQMYSTHEEQYAYVLSTSYLTGVMPACILLAIWLGGIVGMVYYSYRRVHHEKHINLQATQFAASKANVAPDATNKYFKSTSAVKITLAAWLVVMINCGVILVADGVYVYANLSSETTKTQKEAAQFIIAGFKLIWNFIMIPVLIKYIPAWSLKAIDKEKARSRINHRVHYKACILIFNNIIAPLLATLFSDHNCFRELFEAHDAVNASYYFVTCVYALVSAARGEYICTEYGQVGPFVTTYTPSWQYNYQCGFAVLNNYIPVYFYVYASLLIMQPLIYAVVCLSGSIMKSTRYRNLLPTLFWHHSTKYNRTLLEGLLSSVLNHITVLFTFGIMCPPLAIAILCVIMLQTNLFSTLVGRYVQHVDEVYHNDAEKYESEVYIMLARERKSMSYITFWPMDSCCLVVYVSALFCGLIVFDIAGNDIGGIMSCVFLFVMFVLMLLCVRALKMVKRWQASVHSTLKSALAEIFSAVTRITNRQGGSIKDVEGGIVLNMLNNNDLSISQ